MAKSKREKLMKALADEVKDPAGAAEYAMMEATEILRHLSEIARADPNEIVQHRRTACRYCHGDDHMYQWRDEREWGAAVVAAAYEDREPPDNLGGFGYRETRDPHPGCPRCEGEGIPNVFVADTRKLSPAAKLLYNGLKTTKDGIEIKFRDRDKAVENLMRHYGMFIDRLSVGAGKQGTDPIQVVISPEDAAL